MIDKQSIKNIFCSTFDNLWKLTRQRLISISKYFCRNERIRLIPLFLILIQTLYLTIYFVLLLILILLQVYNCILCGIFQLTNFISIFKNTANLARFSSIASTMIISQNQSKWINPCRNKDKLYSPGTKNTTVHASLRNYSK